MLSKIFNTGKAKIFCISFQRTGTTSVGKFFMEHDYKVANYPISKKNDWTGSWFSGDFEAIFKSKDFQNMQVFEDNPWWCLDFYKYLFHRFPNSKFVLFTRNPDKWFDSMVSHSGGKTLGNTHRHCYMYRRELEFEQKFEGVNLYNEKLDNLLTIDESMRSHYIDVYNIRNKQVQDFFKEFGSDRLVTCNLEDTDKWQKLGNYFNISVKEQYEVHANKS